MDGKFIDLVSSAEEVKEDELFRYDFLKLKDFSRVDEISLCDALTNVEYERAHAKTPEEKEVFKKRETELMEWLANNPCMEEELLRNIVEEFAEIKEEHIKLLEEEEAKSGAMESMSVF